MFHHQTQIEVHNIIQVKVGNSTDYDYLNVTYISDIINYVGQSSIWLYRVAFLNESKGVVGNCRGKVPWVMSTGAEQFRRFVARRERVEWKAGWWKDTGKESEAGCRAREQRRTGDIETRTVTDKPSVNYKLLQDVPRLRKVPSISLNRGADKAVRCTSKRKRLHERRCSTITQTVATMQIRQVFACESLFPCTRHTKQGKTTVPIISSQDLWFIAW